MNLSPATIADKIDNQDCSRERFHGYDSQQLYQRDLKLFYDGKICGALNSAGKFCRNKPLENGRCKYHGGRLPKGREHHNYKTGLYSKYIPEALMNKYKEASKDENLLSLRNEAALLTSRIMELTELSAETAGKGNFKELMLLYKKWRRLVSQGSDTAIHAKQDFEEKLEEIGKDLQIWHEIIEVVDKKRRIVDSEQKKMKTMSQYVPVERVMILVGALMDIVMTEVESLEGMLVDKELVKKTNTAVARKFKRITSKNSEYYAED